MSILDEIIAKQDISDEDLKRLIEYTEELDRKIEEEEKNPSESSSELIRKQLNEERKEYMKRWLEMTEEEKMQEAERRCAIVDEIAERTGAKVKEVKIKTDGDKNGKKEECKIRK